MSLAFLQPQEKGPSALDYMVEKTAAGKDEEGNVSRGAKLGLGGAVGAAGGLAALGLASRGGGAALKYLRGRPAVGTALAKRSKAKVEKRVSGMAQNIVETAARKKQERALSAAKKMVKSPRAWR